MVGVLYCWRSAKFGAPTWLALLGGLVFLWGGWRRNPSALGFSAVYSIAGLWLYWSNWFSPQTIYGPNLLAILLLLGQ